MNLELLFEISVIITFTVLISVIVRKGLAKIQSMRVLPEWIRSLAETFYAPARWLTLGYGGLLILEMFSRMGDITLTGNMLIKIRTLYFVVGATWVILGWKIRFQDLLMKRATTHASPQNEKQLIIGVGKIINAVIFVTAGFMCLETIGVPIGSLSVFGGVGAATIGFAGKDVFANFFGGMMIHINRPFSLGDWIMSPNKNFEGVVEEIGWYMTRIRTFARRPTYIPNALMTEAIVENPGRMYNRRIKTMIGLRYCDIPRVENVVVDIREMLKNHDDIDQKQFLFVHFVAYGAHSIDVEIYCFTKTTKWETYRNIQQDVYLKVAQIVEKNGAEFAFPTQTLHIEPVENGGLTPLEV